MRQLNIFVLISFCLLQISISSCSLIKKPLCRSEKNRVQFLEYVLSDTTVCYIPELRITDDRIYDYLDTFLTVYENCEYCDKEYLGPEFFTISGRRTFSEQKLHFVHSYFTESISENKNIRLGGFYYKRELFIVNKSIENLDYQFFDLTDCSLRIEKCNLRIVGVCLTTTISLDDNKVNIICDDPFPFIR